MCKNDVRQFQVSKEYIVYWYSNQIWLYRLDNRYSEIRLNPVESDIVEAVNAYHDLAYIWEYIASLYSFPVNDHEAKSLFDNLIAELLEKNIIEPGNITRNTYGEKGKCYPFLVSIEMTNCCNFRCSHCYKEAGNERTDFISMDKANEIIGALNGKVHSIELTGGEATLHPQFSQIVKIINTPYLSLLTNGSQLYRIDPEILKKFSSIQVSLYGCTQEEFSEVTSSNQFSMVCDGIKRVSDMGIPLVIAVILRKSNFRDIEKYLTLLERLGVHQVRFGTSLKTGRNATDTETDWDLSDSECKLFSNQLQSLRHKFPSIAIDNFDEDSAVRFDRNKKQYHFTCDAGTSYIAVSEKGMIRPCVYLPPQYFEMHSIEEYLLMVQSGKSICYDKCIQKCLKDLRAMHHHLDEVCPHAFS